MRLKDLFEGILIEAFWGSAELEVQGIAMDSRTVTDGELFVCLQGAYSDGHDHVEEALGKGAAAILACREDQAFRESLRRLSQQEEYQGRAVAFVKDTREALAHVATNWYGHPARQLITIGITGTKGKTTTSYMVRSILENAGRRVGLIGTNEVIIGRRHMEAGNTTPESLILQGYLREMVDAGLDTVVMEVSSQAIKLKRTEGILFDYGVFTNLSPDHIAPAEHHDFQEYLECKRQLFRQCRYGIINGDDSYAMAVTEGHTCVLETYGLGEDCLIRAKDLEYKIQNEKLGVAFQVTGKMDFAAYLPLPGKFSVYNALAAICICRHFRVRESDVQRSLAAARVKGRIETVEGTKGYTILIDYAHNPMALQSLLETMREYRPGRLICLFGCGGNRPVMRRKRMGQISGRLADLTVITDDNPRDEDPGVIREQILEGVMESGGEWVIVPDRRKAIQYCIENAREGDLILLAGKGHEIFQEIRGKFYPMDEREIVRGILTK